MILELTVVNSYILRLESHFCKLLLQSELWCKDKEANFRYQMYHSISIVFNIFAEQIF